MNSLFSVEVFKRGLQNYIVEFTLNEKPYHLKMNELIEMVEQKSEKEKEFINKTIHQLGLLDNDIIGFVKFLAKSYVRELDLEKEFRLQREW